MAEATTTEATETTEKSVEELAALLIEKPPETSQTVTTETPESKETATAEASTPEKKAETTETSATDQPGTPDKLIQKMQQDLAASDRKLTELLEKIEAGESLTPKEQQQAQQAQRKIDTIKTAMAGKSFDVLDSGEAIAETLLETDQAVQGLRQSDEQRQQEVQSLRKDLSELQAEKTWTKLGELYPGVNVQNVWKTCAGEAVDLLGDKNPALNKYANKIFHERADAAAKSLKAKQPEKKPGTKVPTPGNAEVQVVTDVSTAQKPDESQEYLNRAMSLVKSED